MLDILCVYKSPPSNSRSQCLLLAFYDCTVSLNASPPLLQLYVLCAHGDNAGLVHAGASEGHKGQRSCVCSGSGSTVTCVCATASYIIMHDVM